MNTDTLIKERLKGVADKYHPVYGDKYESYEQFRIAIETCYSLIANRTGQRWNEYFGKDRRMTQEEFRTSYQSFVYAIPRTPIHSKDFKDSLCRYRDFEGKQKRIPYTPAVECLEKERVISVCKSYSNNKAKTKKKDRNFTMQYGLENLFLMEILDAYLEGRTKTRPFNIYTALCGYYPDKLMAKKLKKAKSDYEALKPVNGIRLELPPRWDEKCSQFGWFSFDEDLSLDNLLLDIDHFKLQRSSGYTYGRLYDWFTMCSKGFRSHLFIGDKNFKELIDCHSGMFWMLAIAGYKEGEISKEECLKMVEHCFSGTFYTDLSGAEKKTRDLKTKFMSIANNHDGQLIHNSNSDYVYYRTICTFQAMYTEWWAWLETRRKIFKNNIGLMNHKLFTSIEREIMDELKEQLEETGHKNLFRVHDALYGVEEINNIEAILFKIVLKYIDKKQDYSRLEEEDSYYLQAS